MMPVNYGHIAGGRYYLDDYARRRIGPDAPESLPAYPMRCGPTPAIATLGGHYARGQYCAPASANPWDVRWGSAGVIRDSLGDGDGSGAGRRVLFGAVIGFLFGATVARRPPARPTMADLHGIDPRRLMGGVIGAAAGAWAAHRLGATS